MLFSMPQTGRSTVTGGSPARGTAGPAPRSRQSTSPMLAACSPSAPPQNSATATTAGARRMSDGQPGRFLDLGQRASRPVGVALRPRQSSMRKPPSASSAIAVQLSSQSPQLA